MDAKDPIRQAQVGRRLFTRSRLARAASGLTLLGLIGSGVLGLAALAGWGGAEAAGAQQVRASSVPASIPGLWRDEAGRAVGATSQARHLITGTYRAVVLDKAILDSVLARAPREFSVESGLRDTFLELPWPDGGWRMYRIEESPIMAPELAAQFPEIRTYKGQGIDDPTASLRLDWTDAGFHAMVLSAEGTMFVDPDAPGDLERYIAYFKRDFQRPADQLFECGVTSDQVSTTFDVVHKDLYQPAHGTQLREYRLALAATGEYTATKGGTVPGALSGMTTTMNRVNGIYERDFSVRMTLIANTSSVIYTNGTTDPYTNNSGSTMLCENARNIDTVIGSANYDIGHVFSTGGGGIAQLASVCSNTNACGAPAGSAKARGVTGSASPVGDPFDVDYVAHEMGHQFGANHTFNGTTGSCGGGNRNASTAYEPGSGTTIMAYAGICGAENIQPNSDALFHAASQTEIISFITNGSTGGSCPVTTATGNTPPVVDAGAAYTIPMGTPFTLTAVGSDVNGDSLTYAWEEFDLGTASPPDTDDGTRPLFRSNLPSSSPSRTFPKLSDILANTQTFGERLPATARTMTFRVTARDNRAGGGGTASDDTTVTVRSDMGPFVVTQPNTAVTWLANSLQQIVWDPANTTSAPVSAASVQILLSTDGGATFPTVLAASTANDGSETITVPNVSTTTARIKVMAVGNIFFDISNSNFTISQGGAAPDLIVSAFGGDTAGTAGANMNVTATVMNQGAAAAGASRLGFYFSTDSIVTTADTFGGSCNIGALAIGASLGCSGPITVPALASGTYYFGAIADDQGVILESNEANNVSSRQVTVTGAANMAVYDSTLKVPTCSQSTDECDSGSLLNGRDTITGGAEPNQPNTLGGLCTDGNQGVYQTDESINRIRVFTTGGGPFAPGKNVTVEVTVFPYGPEYFNDSLDIYYTANARAANPTWNFVTTLSPSAAGSQVLSTTFNLPAGGWQAVRAAFRYLGSASACTNGGGIGVDESDDVAFRVGPGLFALNADNNGDVFVYRSSTGAWYRENTQNAGYWTESAGGWSPGWSVQSANFNGDTLTDLFLFNTTNGQWYKMLNTGSGWTVQANGAWWPGWQRYVLDLDGDGTSDLFLYDPATGAWWKCTSTGGGFTYAGGGWSPGWEIYPMMLNNDAQGDFFLFNRSTGRWYWALGSGSTFTYPQSSVWTTPWVFHQGDFNRDGLTDLLLHNPANGQYYIATTTAAGFTYLLGGWGIGLTPKVLDLTADGYADVFLYNSSTGQWYEQAGLGNGTFTTVGMGFWTGGWTLYPADFNGDGRIDLFLYNPSTGQYWQAWNTANGTFSYFGGGWLTNLTIISQAPIGW